MQAPLQGEAPRSYPEHPDVTTESSDLKDGTSREGRKLDALSAGMLTGKGHGQLLKIEAGSRKASEMR
jgi:hypothetical protein